MKDLKIEIPEGYEIDKEKSTFEHIIFMPISEKINKPCTAEYIEVRLKNGIAIKMRYIDGFYMQDTQVTQGLWEYIMGSNPSNFKSSLCPVENVSYYDCLGFVEKLSKITGLHFRIPTEEEWTKAAGNVDSQNLNDIAWFKDNSTETTHCVGLKDPNNYGLYDMLGNVWEWTSEKSGSCRVYRGGSWSINASYCRSSYRFYYDPGCRSIYLGLRLAL